MEEWNAGIWNKKYLLRKYEEYRYEIWFIVGMVRPGRAEFLDISKFSNFSRHLGRPTYDETFSQLAGSKETYQTESERTQMDSKVQDDLRTR